MRGVSGPLGVCMCVRRERGNRAGMRQNNNTPVKKKRKRQDGGVRQQIHTLLKMPYTQPQQ
jgi:hypothetical protein